MNSFTNIQSKMRDFAGFTTTRKRILELKPGLKASWIAFAVANYAAGAFSVAVEIISKFFEQVRLKK